MKYTPSVNIAQTKFNEQSYIITQNARCVVGNIINSFNSGIHSFNVIGSYGTGKSSFILALEYSLKNSNYGLTDNVGQFNNFNDFEFIKIVGDYASITTVISEHIPKQYVNKNIFESLLAYYNDILAQGKFLFIVVDEFGKILEYAAKNNPEKELYALQKVAEFVNDGDKNIILLTTLHQNFSSYAKSLSESQRNEWIKVKGRFGEIVFNEPVEQLLHLAAARLEARSKKMLNRRFKKLFDIAKESKFISPTFDYEIAERLYPIDMFAAQALALSIQRYGQNERTLFSFLEAQGVGSLKEFDEHPIKTYSLADVYDYATYTFYSYLSEVNSDSSSWSAMRVALEKVEGLLDIEYISPASKLIKSIGLLNLFGGAGASMTKEMFETYAKHALGVENYKEVIALLERHQIIRFAIYKSQYVIFEGTDVNIEDELLQAAGRVPRSRDIVEKFNCNFNLPTEFANSVYYKKGTPRYFQYNISEHPTVLVPMNEIDGYINLVFNSEPSAIDNIKECSSNCKEAILFAYFKKTESIVGHLWEIDKLEYVQVHIDDKDLVAHRELRSLMAYEKEQLNNCVINTLFSFNKDIVWIYNGKEIIIENKTHFNKMLSLICEEVYSQTPIFINEMVNKHKPSSAMSLARVKYFEKLLDESSVEDLGFEIEKFPPEKLFIKPLPCSRLLFRL